MNALVRIPDRDRRRVVSAAGLLASDKDGEVVAAARAVCRLLKPLGTTPAALIDAALAPKPSDAGFGWEPVRDHRHLARACLAMDAHLNAWEIGFLDDVSRQPRLTDRQLAKLRQIQAKLDGVAA